MKSMGPDELAGAIRRLASDAAKSLADRGGKTPELPAIRQRFADLLNTLPAGQMSPIRRWLCRGLAVIDARPRTSGAAAGMDTTPTASGDGAAGWLEHSAATVTTAPRSP